MLWLLSQCSIFSLQIKPIWLFRIIKKLCGLLHLCIEKDLIVYGNFHKSIANLFFLYRKIFDSIQQSIYAPIEPLSTIQVLLVLCFVARPSSFIWKCVLSLALNTTAMAQFMNSSLISTTTTHLLTYSSIALYC